MSLQIEIVVNANINTGEFLQNSHTKRLPTCVCRICDVLFEVLKYDVFGDGPLVGEKYPRPQECLPQQRFLICGNSCWILCDDLPFIWRIRSLIASFGGTDTNLWT